MRLSSFLLTAVVFATGSLLPVHGAGPLSSPITFSPALHLEDRDRMILERYIGHAVKYAGELTAEKVATRCADAPEMFAWVEFPYLNCLLDAFELTEDTSYLDVFKQRFSLFRSIMNKGDDGYLGWFGKAIPLRRLADKPDLQIDELQCNFRAITILSRFVELSQRKPAYAESNQEVISQYLDLMENHLFPKWDTRGFFLDLKSEGAIYRGLDYPLCNPKTPGPTLSHEKCSILVDGLLGLYRVTNNSLYMRRAIQLGTRFKHCLGLKDGHYEWMSWEPGGIWDVNPTNSEKWITGWIAPDPLAEWYEAAVSIAVNLYQHGVVFDEQDMARFITTQKTRCWNGDFESPQYRTVSGVSHEDNKYIQGRFLSRLLALYDADLSRLAFDGPHEGEVLDQSTSPWKGCVAAGPYVRSKYFLRPGIGHEKQPFVRYGKSFLANSENHAFYERLRFTVVAPGRVTPMSPSQRFPTPVVQKDLTDPK